jgi:hypothetical protein
MSPFAYAASWMSRGMDRTSTINPLTMIIQAKELCSILLGRYHRGSIWCMPNASRTALAFVAPVLLLMPKAAHSSAAKLG